MLISQPLVTTSIFFKSFNTVNQFVILLLKNLSGCQSEVLFRTIAMGSHSLVISLKIHSGSFRSRNILLIYSNVYML